MTDAEIQRRLRETIAEKNAAIDELVRTIEKLTRRIERLGDKQRARRKARTT